MTRLRTERYEVQRLRWPARGRHVLAQFDDRGVVVYQAYRPSIGLAAAGDGRFGGGGFSLGRMRWIKPNFLWMMYRCGWAAKEGQEVVLAVTLARAAFDEILVSAVPSSFGQVDRYPSRAAWEAAVKSSDVRLQWDPDHHPSGSPHERRAVQLGLRGETLAKYAHEWILSIEDVTPFVVEQRERRGGPDLVTPAEDVYPCPPAAAAAIGCDPFPA